jgi:hypothetical protein
MENSAMKKMTAWKNMQLTHEKHKTQPKLPWQTNANNMQSKKKKCHALGPMHCHYKTNNTTAHDAEIYYLQQSHSPPGTHNTSRLRL